MASKRSLAMTQANEMARMERLALKSIRPSISQIQEQAQQQLGRFNIQANDMTSLKIKLRDAFIASHILGMRRTRLIVGVKRPRSLSASLVTEVLSKFRDISQSELDMLATQYEADTIRVLRNLSTRLNDGVRDALKDAIESGVTPKAAIKSFFSKLGISENSPYFYETLLRTQTQIAYQAAAYAEYQSPDIQDIIWGFQYITVGDDRVRPSHAAMNGITLPKDDSFWKNNWPPNGYNCRCSALPVMTDEKHQFKVRRAGSNTAPDRGFAFNPAELAI